ncbi:MAG TPA: hypothetical protein PL155_04775 [Candidatus Omnitrophota bacterium]|nr:hypothetical protein [Candidatus Omnitrophota bacterium]HPD84208.1 hypothetical protein [Candidatus Omnitrophota bacterium]HRZ03064.1 hypothetical protein [Candidatus Omnitrophota bacterium]
MPYDKSLDVAVFKEIKDFGDTRITVGVFSYNNGEKKLQMSREDKIQGEDWQYVKLGRLTKNEAEGILPLINQALGKM